MVRWEPLRQTRRLLRRRVGIWETHWRHEAYVCAQLLQMSASTRGELRS